MQLLKVGFSCQVFGKMAILGLSVLRLRNTFYDCRGLSGFWAFVWQLATGMAIELSFPSRCIIRGEGTPGC